MPVSLHSDQMSSDQMHVEVATTRFGTVVVETDQLIDFPDGMIGLGGHRYALLPTGGPFYWLQSCEHPALALPVTEPRNLFADYPLALTEVDAARIGKLDDTTRIFLTVTVRHEPMRVTANQKAPILVRRGLGFQVVNQADGMQVRAAVADAASTG